MRRGDKPKSRDGDEDDLVNNKWRLIKIIGKQASTYPAPLHCMAKIVCEILWTRKVVPVEDSNVFLKIIFFIYLLTNWTNLASNAVQNQ